MFKVAGNGPIKVKLTPDYSPGIDSTPTFSGGQPTWDVVREAQVRSEVLLLYPQDVMTPPDTGPTSAGDLNAPQENGSGSTTAAQAATGDAKIDGILSGVKWASGITYSDVDSPADYQAGYSSDADGDGISAQNEGFSAFTAQQTLALHTALNDSTYTQLPAAWGFSIEAFTNLSITYNGAGSSTATIRAANSSDAGTAYAYYPNNSIYGGDTFFGNNYDSTIYSLKTPTAGNYAWHTMLHELGHSLGLKHGQETGGPANVALPYNWDSVEFSVMTYRSYVGAPLSGYSYEQWGAPQTYMMLDIAALQAMYGADFTVQSGNTTYSWSPTTGETFINGSLAIDPGGNRIFATIWDGGGIDTYDLSNYSTNLSLDLNPGGYSVFSAAQQAYLGGGNYARGNIFNALLYQNNSASMIENAIGGSGNDSIVGNFLDNVLTGNGGDDSIYTGSGNDTAYGGDGNDYLFGDTGDDTLYGGAGDDVIDGSYGTDVIYGGAGNDIIYGSWTTDTVYGEAGDDTFVIRQTSVDIEYGDNTDGGSGTDRLDLSQITATYGAIVNLSTGTWQYNPLYGGPWTITGVENVDGTQLDDDITGDSGANVLNGNSGKDTIRGGAGDDTINGGAGDDLLIGGAGNDVFDGGSGTDIIYGEAGDDTFKIVAGWTGSYGEIFVGGAGSDTFDMSGVIGFSSTTTNLTDGTFDYQPGGSGAISLASIENVIGSSVADSITGSGEVNRLYGLAGNDTLRGLGGDDVLEGGDGNDLLDGGTGSDTASYASAAGAVTVSLAITAAQATVSAGSDTLTGIENLLGSAYNDKLTGDAGNNILDGGTGADILTGGDGDDTYYVDNGSDNVVEGSTGGTADKIFSSVSYSLSGRYVETLSLTGSANINATGNSAANTLSGNIGANILTGLGGDDVLNGGSGNDTLDGGDGNDILIGGNGADSMTGGNGDDIYYVDSVNDKVIESSATGGNDQIFSSVTYSLAGRTVEVLTLTGVAAISATGNTLAQTLNGNDGDNGLYGLDGNDILNGNDGNDILEGGNGNDSLNGGAGSDTATYATATAAVTVSLAVAGAQATGGAGTDTLTGIENLTGSAFADTLTGDGNANVLNGGAGADILVGGAGNDIYYVDNIGDVVTEGSTEGTNDTIYASVTYGLAGRYAETLILTGSAAINATGNSQDNVLIGNSGNNVINASAGNDTIDGGLGADTLTGGSGLDTFVFSSTLGAGNVDTVTDYSVANDTINLDDAVFAGLALGTLSANAFVIGSAAADADDRIIYNSATGALLFDADGSGAGAAIQFATLNSGLALVASEFVVV